MSPTDQQVVIFVPGTMGSELEKDGDNVWPGDPILDWLMNYSKLPELMTPVLDATDIWRNFVYGLLPIYDPLIDDLEACGFSESATPEPTLYTCPYDWRRPLQDTTSALESVVAKVRSDHGAGVDIILIGHSQGGLLCRYFLESGLYDATPGHGNVRQLILLGVPNLGAPLMLSLARGDRDYVNLDAGQIRQLLNTDGLAFAYLMLPAPSAGKVWRNDGALPWERYDLFTWPQASAVGLTSSANHNSAVAYRNALDGGTRPPGVRYFSLVGTRKKTCTGIIVDTAGGAPTLAVEEIERDDGGDGTVPLWSGWLAGEQGLAVGGQHSMLYLDATVRNALKVLLGCQSSQSMEARTDLELDLGQLVFALGDPIEAAVRIGAATQQAPLYLTLWKAELDPANKTGRFRSVGKWSLE
ncbi:MAG: hypothetical protein P8008_00965, partial [Gammaproteobacteria bacterium]